MKPYHVIIIFLFTTILTACDNKSSSNQVNSDSAKEKLVEVTDSAEEELVEVTEEVEEECSNCLGSGIINSSCPECGGFGYKILPIRHTA